MFQILVAEDDKSAGRLIMDTLSDAGYEPVLAADGLQAYAMLTQRHVDLLVLDLMLPELDGFALLHQLRESGSTLPVLVLTAREAIADKRRGLRAGADDYMVKPADEEELLLRIAALLRRSRQACEHRLAAGGTTLNYDDLAVESQGVQVDLSRKEFLLLYKLLSCPGKTFTRRQLMDEIWDMDSTSEEHTVTVHINRLREKFRDNRDFSIVTVHGLGYKAVRL